MARTKYRYELVKSKKFLCVGAVLETVIKCVLPDSKIDQVSVAEYFGVCVPPTEAFPVDNKMISNDPNKWGITIKDDELNKFFDLNQLPFHENYVSISKPMDWEFEMLIRKAILEQKHIICDFSWDFLNFNTSNLIGHVAIVSGIDDNLVSVLDPGPEGYGLNQVDLYQLYKSIKIKKDGVWIIESSNATV